MAVYSTIAKFGTAPLGIHPAGLRSVAYYTSSTPRAARSRLHIPAFLPDGQRLPGPEPRGRLRRRQRHFRIPVPHRRKSERGSGTERGLATRACQAELSWNKQKLVIAASAPRIDVDAFGVDLGVGVPAIAIQVKKSDATAACPTRFIP